MLNMIMYYESYERACMIFFLQLEMQQGYLVIMWTMK